MGKDKHLAYGTDLKKSIEIIREEIEERGMIVLKIILFGSRAKGTFREDSDWDILIGTLYYDAEREGVLLWS